MPSETNNNLQKARRELLKGIAAGSGALIAGKSLPETWSRPVVDSVMLPAHAQTSGAFTATTRGLTMLEGDSLLASAGKVLVQDAQAGETFSSLDVSYCATLNNDNTAADVTVIVTAYDWNNEGCTENFMFEVSNVPVGGDPVLLNDPSQEGCPTLILEGRFTEDGKGLLARLGLVNDASAGRGENPDTIQITNAGGRSVTGVLSLLNGQIVDNFTLGVGTCEAYVPVCDGCDVPK